jgi:inosose dehydratase
MTNFKSRRGVLIGLAAFSTYSLFNSNEILAGSSRFSFGYHAITWKGEDTRAIEDISSLKFRGIQLRLSAYVTYKDRPRELRELLRKQKLKFVAMSGRGVTLKDDKSDLDLHIEHAKFIHKAGGMYLQTGGPELESKTRPTAEEFQKLGRLLTEAGKRTQDMGIPLAYHNHMGTYGESPAEVEMIMNESDPRYVKLLLDTGHYFRAGGDSAAAIRKYRDRILFMHLKDVAKTDNSNKFVELGQGEVNFPDVFKALNETGFKGWLVIELDRVPDANKTPKESALISKSYIENRLKIKF